MATPEEALKRLADIPSLKVSADAPLSLYTRFAIGGPADVYAETDNAEAFIRALSVARQSGLDINAFQLVDAEHSHAAARQGR